MDLGEHQGGSFVIKEISFYFQSYLVEYWNHDFKKEQFLFLMDVLIFIVLFL